MSCTRLVVIVEDHQLHARLLRRAVKARLPDSDFELFADGSQAARRLEDPERGVPDLLVFDLVLPGRSGHELLADRAADERLRGVPAAIVTSSTDEGDRERSLALGADLHLIKPVDTDGFATLADKLVALLGR